MKRIISILSFAIFAVSFTFSDGMKNDTDVTFSVTPIDKDEDDNVQFGGAYLLVDSKLNDDYVTLGGKLYYRLNKTDSKEEESQKLEVKRAFAKVRPFGNDIFEFALGKLYSYYLTGGYFSLTETYTGATRWGKTGIGAKTEYQGFTFGVALPLTESYVAFKKDWGINFAASYNFSSINKELPLTFGFDVQYGATADGEADVNSVSEKDFSECVAANFSKRNFSIFKTFSVFAAFSHNAEPYVANSMLSPVAIVDVDKKSPQYADFQWLKKSNIFSLAIRPTIGKVRITSESEIGHSVGGNMIPFYTALQVYAPIHGIFAIKPMAGYYAAYETSDSAKSFDTWEFYPRAMLEFEKWTITAGWDMFYKKIAESEYRWTWTVPVTAKLRIDGK